MCMLSVRDQYVADEDAGPEPASGDTEAAAAGRFASETVFVFARASISRGAFSEDDEDTAGCFAAALAFEEAAGVLAAPAAWMDSAFKPPISPLWASSVTGEPT